MIRIMQICDQDVFCQHLTPFDDKKINRHKKITMLIANPSEDVERWGDSFTTCSGRKFWNCRWQNSLGLLYICWNKLHQRKAWKVGSIASEIDKSDSMECMCHNRWFMNGQDQPNDQPEHRLRLLLYPLNTPRHKWVFWGGAWPLLHYF